MGDFSRQQNGGCIPVVTWCSQLPCCINSLSNVKIVDWSNLKAFADNTVKVTVELYFVFGRVENIVGKGKNAGYQHFLLFPQCFQKLSFSGSLRLGIVR